MVSRGLPGIGLHRCAILLAGATVLLIFVGGLVTSTGSGLSVPDWPLSFGQVFPPMVGGVFYEHGHRMVATAVGLLTVVLTIWILRVERRPALRRLAAGALVTVIAQGLLGGLTVLLQLPPAVSVAHACVAQLFLCLTVALAVLTTPGWDSPTLSGTPDHERPRLATLTTLTVAAVFGQLILGAVMRHTGAGLAIPDFPLAFGRILPPLDLPGVPIHFAHRIGALVVTFMIGWTTGRIRQSESRTPPLVRGSLLATGLVIAQVTLGAITVWTGKAVLPTTAHVAVGAAILATTVVLALHARHLLPERRSSLDVLRGSQAPV